MVAIADGVICICLFSVALMILISLDASMKRLERKIKRIDLSLSLLLNRMEIEVPSQDHLSDRVKQIALDPYRKIEAIKLYREETQSGLREAKEVIEEFIERDRKK